MPRLAATAVLLLSLLAVASCRVLEAEPQAAVVISDEQGGQAGPAVHEEASDAAEAIPSLPAATVAEGILRLPSHRRPCRHGFLHRLLRWDRHHGPSHRRNAFPGPGDALGHPAVVLPEEPKEAELEAIAEPDPDTRPDDEGERQIPFHGEEEEEEEEEENESVKAWQGEMLRRFGGHGISFHHHHKHAEEKDHSDDKEGGAGDMHVKLFSRYFHHHNHGDEEQEETARKHHFHHHHHHHGSDNEVDEVEELARKLSKAIMRRSLSRGGIRHHLHHHHAEESGVKKWFKGLLNMNRF